MGKILVASCVRQDETVLGACLKTLAALEAPNGYTLEYAFVDDNDVASLALVDGVGAATILKADPRPAEAAYEVGDETHHWQVATFEHLAIQKQKLLALALDGGYDGIFIVDSDLLLEPTTLMSLWATKADVVSGVFWTAWQRGGQPMPQVWTRHPYEFDGLGQEPWEVFMRLANREVLRVAGGGACYLIRRSALVKGAAYHPRFANLPEGGMWQGEDRSFALRLERLRMRQHADAWPMIYHAYHPQDRTPEALLAALEEVLAPRQQAAGVGDWINATIEPLEDPMLQDMMEPEVRCVRGRLGCMKLLPQLEDAIAEMTVGETRMLSLQFPGWWPLSVYAGQQKLVQLTLVDVKPNG